MCLQQTVFIPEVRIVECDHVGPKFVRSKAYIRYPRTYRAKFAAWRSLTIFAAKTIKDYEDIIEYDADSDDEEFLQSLNGDVKSTPKRKTANQKLKTVSSPVHIDQFEKIMDALEKAAYQQVSLFLSHTHTHAYLPLETYANHSVAPGSGEGNRLEHLPRQLPPSDFE